MDLKISQLEATFKGLDFKCFWYPGITLGLSQADELIDVLDSLNQSNSPVKYGFFSDHLTIERRRRFLNSSIWCVIEKDGVPCGFAYNYDLGQVDETHTIHQGLVKFNLKLGADVILFAYLCMARGNILNHGRFLATSVSHVPLIVSLFHDSFIDCQPAFLQRSQLLCLTPEYRSACESLIERYLLPILGYDPTRVDFTTLLVHDSLVLADHKFQTLWRVLPKSGCPQRDADIANLLMVDPLDRRARVAHDLIQIGWCDEGVFLKPRNRMLLAEATFRLQHENTIPGRT